MLNTLAELVDIGRQHEAAVAEAPRHMQAVAKLRADRDLVAFLGDGECLPPVEMRRLATVLRLMCAVRANRAETYGGEDAYHEAREAFETAASAVAAAIEAEAAEDSLSRSQQLAMFGLSVAEEIAA